MGRKIGITGGIGTGKTTASKLFERLGIPVFYADYEAKWLMENKETIKIQLIQLFGKEAFHNGTLNRGYLAGLIFKNKALKKKLEHIIHPAVALHFEKWVEQHKDQEYVLKEAALIYETKGEDKLDAVIVIHAEEQKRVQRVRERDKSTVEQIMARINNQMDQQLKVDQADFLIENNKDQKALKAAVAECHQKILAWIARTSE